MTWRDGRARSWWVGALETLMKNKMCLPHTITREVPRYKMQGSRQNLASRHICIRIWLIYNTTWHKIRHTFYSVSTTGYKLYYKIKNITEHQLLPDMSDTNGGCYFTVIARFRCAKKYLPCDAMHSMAYAMAWCLSVCMSVCHIHILHGNC